MRVSFAVVMGTLAACSGAAQHPPVVNPPVVNPPVVNPPVVQTPVATPTPIAEEPTANATPSPARGQRVTFSIGAAQLSTLKQSAPAGLTDLTVTGCGRLADLVPLRAITTLTRVQLGTDDCLEVARLDGSSSSKSCDRSRLSTTSPRSCRRSTSTPSRFKMA